MKGQRWVNENDCEFSELEKHIEHEREILAKMSGAPFVPEIPGITEELIKYHYHYKPHANANLIY